ncbi:DNA gyrase/topoisomerase IV subunit A [Bacillus cereus]|uniref:DNA gyrase/topoisomerase IV subunit A n=1 Tax=Bacillus cereus TaxID=1396 RepID=UPI000BFD824C|nr:DNA topoisomerase (ATP-hydrolyzing) [Bacillus cereus]PGR83674.1 DNA topoisomerase IV subunit A [Bacillus cereus]
MAETIERVEISDVAEERFSDFAKYSIQSRALPDVRDGLKPVQRRALYAMSESGNVADKPYRKSARSVGEVIGKYHPHGDTAVYEAMVRMSQHWKVAMPLIDMHGNNGSLDGDSPAAMRYTEARLSKIVTECMTNGLNKKGVVPFVDNFDDTEKEPVVFPVQFPNLLVNGATGISVGYKTDIPPHNLGELMDACIYLRKNPTATTEEIMQFVPAPDFPTGGIISGASSLVPVYETGKGDIKVRARYRVEEDKKRKYIIFEDIPYELKKAVVVDKLKEIVKEKQVVGVLEARDESDLKEPIRIVVECAKDADLRVILGFLFSKTPLQKNYKMKLLAIKDGKPVEMGIKAVLQSFNAFRTETRRNELVFDKQKSERRLHVVEGFLRLADNLNAVVPVIQEADGKAGAKQAIMERFGFTEMQAEEIVTLRLHRLSKTDKQVYEKEKTILTTALKALHILLTNEEELNKHIIKMYEKVKEAFAVPRRTEVKMDEETWDVVKVDTIKEENVVVSLSQEGYIKRSSMRSYSSTPENGLNDGDSEVFVGQTTTKENILVFTNKGRYLYIPVHEIEEEKWKDVGKNLAGYGTEFADGETIVRAFPVSTEDKEKSIVMAKSNGLVKQTKVADHEVTRRFFSFYQATKIKEEETVVDVWLVDTPMWMGCKDEKGRSMYFSTEEIPVTGTKTSGVKGINLEKDGNLAEVLLTATEEEMPEEYRRRERGKKGFAVR